MTESMIERIEQALDDVREKRGFPPIPQYAIRHYAVAAIEAMREPTDLMWEAGAESLYGHPRQKAEEWAKSEKYENCGHIADEAYKKIINAALTWPTGSADRAGVPLAKD